MSIGPGPGAIGPALPSAFPTRGMLCWGLGISERCPARLGISAPSTTRAAGKLNAVATISISGGDSSSSVEFVIFLGRRVRNAEALIWPRAIGLNGNVPIAVMPNGLGEPRTATVFEAFVSLNESDTGS
jgi:hypothetical protein